MESGLRKFTLYDLILIASLCAVGLAIKPIINPFVRIVSSSLRIPGGSLSGGFLMMWMVLARVIVNKPGSAFFYGLSQGLAVMLLGFFGSHGVFSVVSYTLPGVAMEVVALFLKPKTLDIGTTPPLPPHTDGGETSSPHTERVVHQTSLFTLCLYCVVANVTGTLVVAVVVLQAPPLLLAISVISATLSGMLGGYLADIVLGKMRRYGIV